MASSSSRDERKVFFAVKKDAGLEYGTVGTVIRPGGGDGYTVVLFPEFVMYQELEVKSACLRAATNTVEMESGMECVKVLHVKQKCTTEPESFTYTGYSVWPRATPDRDVEVKFGVVGGLRVCAVDRGMPRRPWVFIRNQGAASYPYKEERFYYWRVPAVMKFKLRGPSWAVYVSEVWLDGCEQEGTACHVPAGDLPVGSHVVFRLQQDRHIPYCAEGFLVGPTVGPDGEPGYVRVRFLNSTWDLETSALAGPVESQADGSYQRVVRGKWAFEVWNQATRKRSERSGLLGRHLGEGEGMHEDYCDCDEERWTKGA